MVIMIGAGKFWGFMPAFLDSSNPFTLWCNTLASNVQTFGNVSVTIVQNGKPIQNLIVNLSVERPPKADHPGAQLGEFKIPQKACFVSTNLKGMATFMKVPAGTAYIFFNNDPAAYPKRFGRPNWTITPVDVKQGTTIPISIDVNLP